MPVWGEVFGATERLVAGAEAPRARIEAVIEYLRRLQYESGGAAGCRGAEPYRARSVLGNVTVDELVA